MPGFVHLHTHTEFSLLDGLSSPKALANYAAELGMPALAVTDHGTMFGIVEFYTACKNAGIKPIIGLEAYIAHGSRHTRNKTESKPYHLILLAQNQVGYQNLSWPVSPNWMAFTISRALIRKYWRNTVRVLLSCRPAPRGRYPN